MSKTCTICYWFEDDWNKYAQCYCRKWHCWVDPDTADRCDAFEPDSHSSGCYLTTACCENKGLPDDCPELTALRSLRDGYMQTFPQGKIDAAMYYKTAPSILEAIQAEPNCKEILNDLYENVIVPCMRYIEADESIEAYRLYKEMVIELSEKYLE